MPTAPRILEWYRGDPWPRMRRVLLSGPAVLTCGGLVVAVSFLTRAPLAGRMGAAVVGLALVAGGALWTMTGMHRILRDELVLALRTDGLLVQSDGSETFVPWDEFESARWLRDRGALVIERARASPIVVSRPFAGVDGSTLAGRIETTKRRAAMNLLRDSR